MLPDSEMFKLIMNGGLFGLFVLFFVWLLFKAEPNYRKTVETIVAESTKDSERQAQAIEKQAEEHKRAMEVVNSTHQKTIETINTTHQRAIETMTKTFEVVISNQLKECRDERREMTTSMISAIKHEGELNRENRHEANNTLMKAIAEIYKNQSRRPAGTVRAPQVDHQPPPATTEE